LNYKIYRELIIQFNYPQQFNMNNDSRKSAYERNKGLLLIKDKEYYEKNKEVIEEYNKNKKEKASKRNSEKVVCKCGAVISRGGKSRHEKTKKHLAYLEIKKN